jgi:hypothetical protein
MRALVHKEIRALLPLYGLVALMFSGDVLTRPFTERLDEGSWAHVASDLAPGSSSGAGIMYLVCAMMVAYAAFPREHDEGTIELLHSLPVSRRSILGAKVVVGLGILLLAAVGGEATGWLLQSLNPQSFSGEQWRFGTAAPVVLLRSALLTIFYCHGLFASFFRRFGLLPILLIAIAIASLIPLAPELAVLDPTEIVAYRYDGQSLIMPVVPLVLHGALAAVSFAIAAALWLGAGERSGIAFDPGKATLGGRVALGCGTALGVAGALVMTVVGLECRADPFSPGPGRSRPRETAPPTSSLDVERRATRCCDLTFPRELAALAAPVVSSVDSIYDEVGRVLGSAPSGRIAIDLTSDADSHLGVASWTTVRVSLRDHEGERELLRTVAHEVAHTFQHRILGDNVDDVREPAAFFLEGSAEWVASRVVPDDDADLAAKRLGAAVWRRHRVRFEELADRDRWRARLSYLLEYPVGEAFARALAAAHGDAAVGAVFRTMATDVAEGYEGRAFWEATLSASGGSLSAVLAVLEDEVARTVRDEAAWIDAIPEIGGGIARVQGGRATVLGLLDRPAPAGTQYYLAVRRHAGADDEEVRGFEGELNPTDPRVVEYDLPASFADRVEAQYGVAPPGSTRAFFTEWRTLVAP